jgi:broad specificity phosphatase PhoE
VVASGFWASIAGSEPSVEFRARVKAALDGLAARHAGGRGAVFSHGGVINAYAAMTVGIEQDFFFPPVNTSISVVRVKDGMRLLLGLNDVCHLREAGLLRFAE